ncbi:DNA repair protein RecN [bacterium]|nr:DNA repair protein RecN [bacterium]
MIKSVSVKNYILIDELTLNFDKGFNVFTGETGAGKSIIIGAIDVALGAKVTKDVIKTGTDKAFIELVISLDDVFDTSSLIENGIEIFDNELVISKEITQTSARSRINGVMVTQDFVKEIREKVLDIHTQHQSYNYVQQKNHIVLLDDFAPVSHRENVVLFKEKYNKYLSLNKKNDELKNLVSTVQQQEDFLKFQIKEIEDAQIDDINECENLEKELDILSNVEKLKELSYSSYWALYGEDANVVDALGTVKSNISKLSSMDDCISPLEEDFITAYETIKEVASQLRDYSDSKENDNERMDYICERLSLLEKIKRKYGNTLEEVYNTYEKLCNELSSIEVSQDELIELEKEIKAVEIELSDLSLVISSSRKELAAVLSAAVTEKLECLELPKSKFEIEIQPCDMNERGVDRVEFMISTNVSEDVKPLAKTASGGEISRVMLAIKSIFAQADKTNTVIFDEIDTGISGKASQSVADEISNLAKSHQIILITHQPIIAAKASSHFYVRKEQADVTKVNVYNLDFENKVKAIALLSAGDINEESTAFAKKLLGV